MKKLLTIIAVFVVNIVVLQAQDNKPTKEETVRFISDFFSVHQPPAVDNVIWKDFDFSFDNTTVKISNYYNWIFEGKSSPPKEESYELDLSKIESIAFVFAHIDEKIGECQAFLNFHPVNDRKIIKHMDDGKLTEVNETRVYIGVVDCSSNPEELKIYKAFDHLRKLCGAPEPISFD